MFRRLLACACAAFVCLSVARAQAPFQKLDFAEALAAAARDQKVVLINFFTTWSSPCKLLDANTWRDEKVKCWLGEKTVALKVDASADFLLARRYSVRGYPAMLFVNSDGLELARLSGFLEPEPFLAAAADALAKADPYKLARDAYAANPSDPTSRMNHALALSLQGRHAEALEHYLWCYDHGLASDESFAGVRDTFLLDEIERLGRVHPPAASVLTERVHRFAAQILEGTASDRDLLDYLALSTRLQLQSDVLELFDRLAEKGASAAAVRKTMATELTELMIERRRYADVFANGPDMGQELARQITRYTNLKGQAERNRVLDTPAAASVLDKLRARTLRNGGIFYEVSLGVGQTELASRIASRLLAFAPEATTYESLVQHALRAGVSDAARALVKRADASMLDGQEKMRIRRAANAPPGAH